MNDSSSEKNNKLRRVKELFEKGGTVYVIYHMIKFLVYVLSNRSTFDGISKKLSILKLQEIKEDERIPQHERAVLEAFEYDGFGEYESISPSQNPSELMELAKYVCRYKPKTVVEIGTSNGGTLYVWTQIFDNAEKFASIDLPEGSFGGGYSENRISFYNSFTDKSMSLLRLNSHDNETKIKLKNELSGDEIDFLFIDGDHTYDGVKKDFEMYKNLVADDGLIAFHDIHPHPNLPDCNVDKFWNEIESEYDTKEIIAASDQEWAGIGIVKM